MYELTYIINQNLSEHDVAAQTDKVHSFINTLGGEIKNEKLGEKRRLAYPINKQEYGFYVTIEFNCAPENIIELDKKISLEPQVLRHLLLTKEIVKQAPRKYVPPKIKEKIEASYKTQPETPEKIEIEEIDKKLEELLEE